jgi:hypothetical protein
MLTNSLYGNRQKTARLLALLWRQNGTNVPHPLSLAVFRPAVTFVEAAAEVEETLAGNFRPLRFALPRPQDEPPGAVCYGVEGTQLRSAAPVWGELIVRVAELQEEQLAIHQQATAEAAANAKVTIESLIAEAEAARMKAMAEKGGAAAAVTALTAKAKLPGMWREKVDQHNTGSPVYERIERVIVERTQSDDVSEPTGGTRSEREINHEELPTPKPHRHWSS